MGHSRRLLALSALGPALLVAGLASAQQFQEIEPTPGPSAEPGVTLGSAEEVALEPASGPRPSPPLMTPVVRLLRRLAKLSSSELLVLSCGAADALDAELRQLDWPSGLQLVTCFPCDAEAVRFLFDRRRGLRLLFLQDARCLPRVRDHLHSHWAAGETVVIPADSCQQTLRFPLFGKVMYPSCVERGDNGTRFVTQRRHDGALVRQRVYSVAGEPYLNNASALLTRADLGGRTVTFLFENYNPFFECLQQNGRVCVSALDTPPKLLIDNLASRLNFRPLYLRGPDGSWGHEEDGVWKGMVGEVARGEADFAIGGLFVTAKRRTVVDFAQEFALVYVNIITRPVQLGVSSDLTRMLSPLVWVLIVASLLLTAVSVLFAKRLLGGRRSWLAQLGSELEDAYRVLTAQDINWSRVMLGRMSFAVGLIVGTWLVSSIVTRTAYTSKLISILTRPPDSWAPETFQDLVDHEYDVVTHAGYGTYTDWMNAQTAPLFQRLKRRWIRGDNAQAFRELTTTRRRLALLEETPGAKSLLYDTIAATRGQVTPAHMHIGREQFFPSNVAWAQQKNTPYAAEMNRRLQLMRQFGLVDKWMADVEREKAQRARREQQKACRRQPELCAGRRFTALTVQQVGSAFLFLLYGYAASALLLAAELGAARAGCSPRSALQTTERRQTRLNGW
ncbi:probable glutamate receptor [Amphibalanus amphitrite]|uniref:probable glutamate receptor n=1 Tax=Amphibalanus amphitrite TaxID=1232801 RepID=UPI001C9181E4|nr:probable glutamate receptor [Amphibalanus amphitrite]